AQLWTRDYRLLLDGPRARPPQIARAERQLAGGGTFGYRIIYPAMRVGAYEVYWQRPVAAFARGPAGEPVLLGHAPPGPLPAHPADRPDLEDPVELWPVLLGREEHLAAVRLFEQETQPRRGHTTANVRAILEWRDLFGALPRPLARALLTLPERGTVEGWLSSLPGKSDDQKAAKRLVAELKRALAGEDEPP